MPEVTSVSTSESAAFQSAYQEIMQQQVESILEMIRRLYQLFFEARDGEKEQKDGEKEQKEGEDEVRVFSGETEVYVWQEKESGNLKESDELSLHQLQEMVRTPVGEKVSASSVRVEVNGQPVLESDSEGKMILNAFNIESRQNQVSEQDYSQPVHSEDRDEKAGTEVIASSLGDLEESPLVDLLRETLNEMRSLRQENLQQQEDLSNLLLERMEQPHDTNWFQSSADKVAQVFQSFQKYNQKNKVASTLEKLFEQQVAPGVNPYFTEGYSLNKQGSVYTLNNEKGEELIQWRSTPMGAKVIGEVKLNSEQYQEIERVSEQLELGEVPSEKFQPIGVTDGDKFMRLDRISNGLTEYAKQQGKKVEVHGQSYVWSATPKGSVSIKAKDGRGELLSFSSLGVFKSNMTDRDIAHFESALNAMQSRSVQKELSQSTQPKPKLDPEPYNYNEPHKYDDRGL